MKKWFCDNIAALVLVLIFIPVFVLTQENDRIREYIGTSSIEFLGGQYYRWFTCIFYHYNFKHIFFNSAALICVGSLLSPFIGKLKTLLIFILGGALAEIPFSLIVHTGDPNFGGGSSGGIYALIAAFFVCYLRFPEEFKLKWFRPDLLIVLIFFIFANDNQSSFLTHTFGFVAGFLLTMVLVLFKGIKSQTSPESL